jgi:hypothetical protein
MRFFGLLGLVWLVAGTPGATKATCPTIIASAAASTLVAEAAAPAATGVQAARGLTEALRVAADTVVARLGRPGGFAADPTIRIPLPGGLAGVRDGLVGAGLGPLVDDLELRMNRAAEEAMPDAEGVVHDVLAEMTIDDAATVLAGPDDGATRYFAQRMGPTLVERMTPIIDAALADAGAAAAFDAFVSEYAAMPLMPDIRGSLTAHVVDGTITGILHYMAEEERVIRHYPSARTSALLRAVFGN